MQDLIVDKNLIFRRFILYLDIKYGGQDVKKLDLGQKMSSFFGQSGIFEGTEKINEYTEDFINSFTVNNYVFNNYVEDKFNYNKNDVIYLPLVFYFYFGDKKADFYFKTSWLKNTTFISYKKMFINLYLYLKSYNSNIIKKVASLNNISNKIKLINKLKFNKDKKNVFSLFYRSYLDTFTFEYKFVKYMDEYFNYLFKKKSRLNFIKKIKVKNKSMYIKMLKKFKNLKIAYVYNFIMLRIVFMDNFYDETIFFKKFLTYLSQLYIYKNNFMLKLRRRKKYYKNIIKNLNGKKFTFIKKYNIEKQKKQKNKR